MLGLIVTRALSWIGGPGILPWVLLGGLALLVSTNAYSYFHGEANERVRSDLETARTQLAAANRDLAVARAAAVESQKAAASLAADRITDRRRVEEYAQNLAARPACVVGDDDIAGLLSIGTPGGKSQPAAGH